MATLANMRMHLQMLKILKANITSAQNCLLTAETEANLDAESSAINTVIASTKAWIAENE